jgi:hypothetical protein
MPGDRHNARQHTNGPFVGLRRPGGKYDIEAAVALHPNLAHRGTGREYRLAFGKLEPSGRLILGDHKGRIPPTLHD